MPLFPFFGTHSHREVEVFELPLSAKVAVRLVRFSVLLHDPVEEQAVPDAPSVNLSPVHQLPAGEIFAVKEDNRFAEATFNKSGTGGKGGVRLPIKSVL